MTRTYEGIEWPDVPFPAPLEKYIVLAGRRGSEAHGTYIPPDNPDSIDDRDVMGIVIPPEQYYYGLSRWEGADSIKGCWDVVLYEIRKFVALLVKQNPNVLSMLWLEDEDYLINSLVGQTLIGNRNLFRARAAAASSFIGYSLSQMKKMRSGVFQGYMGAKRKSLVERYGYDTKNAAHLIRLLHLGIEYLSTGELKVRRTWDRDMILDVKMGKMSLEDVEKYAKSKIAECEAAAKNSDLPEHIDMAAVEDILIAIVRKELGDRE
jgi:predicted nucleotidyltransferase